MLIKESVDTTSHEGVGEIGEGGTEGGGEGEEGGREEEVWERKGISF